MPVLNSINPAVTLNYAGRAQGASRTKHISSYTSRRLSWSTGLDNIVDITVAGQDRNPMNLLNRDLIFTLWDRKQGTTFFRKRAIMIDPANGMVKLVVSANDTRGLESGLYNLSASIVDADGYETLLSWDQDQAGTMDVELRDNIAPPARPTSVLDSWTLSDGIYVSSAVAGPASVGSPSELFSAAIYATDYRGTLKIQGTMDLTMNGMNMLWADLKPEGAITASIILTGYTGILPFNFRSGMRWLRVTRTDSESNTGSLDKILLRV